MTLGIFQLLLGAVAARTQQGYDWGMGPRSNLTQYFCRPGAFATNSPFRPAVVLRSAKPARNKSNYLGLEPKSAAAAVAPQCHLADVEIPGPESFQGTHGWSIERQQP